MALLHEVSSGKAPLHAKTLKGGTAVYLHASSALVGGQRNAPALLQWPGTHRTGS